jgi:type IV secretory pathway VirB4 component
MADTKNKKQFLGNPTQSFLKFSEIRDDTIIMQDGTLRAILTVSSTNFDLKSEEEQNALIYSYQRFLNSLEFHVQIILQSRKMDIGEYTGKLKTMAERQTNELLRMQTTEYIEFIDRLVESANVMNKNFYVVVPYDLSITPAAGGIFNKIFGTGKVKQIQAKQQSFAEYGKQLDERTASVASNLGSAGLRVVRLNTDQLIELVYNSYNFGAGPAIDASQLPNVTITNINQEAAQ